MTDRIKDAFQHGLAIAKSRELSEQEAQAERMRFAKQLWEQLKRYANLVEQKGYFIGELDSSGFKLHKKNPPWPGYACVYWHRGEYICCALDEAGNYVHRFGTTPIEAAEKLMYYIAQDAICISQYE